MDLWWKISGYTRIRMTAADPERSLRTLSRNFRLENVVRISDLELEFSVPRGDVPQVLTCLQRSGDTSRIVDRSGGTQVLKKWIKQPVLAAILLVLLMASFWLPTRILFVQIEGNQSIPSRLILETAAECGVSFGASRSALRSEQVKNQLLEAIPDLSWVGVNTSGCVATITVRERNIQPEEDEGAYGSIIAICDAVISEIIPSSGEVRCTVGQAVRSGQVLISGYTDLGICTRVVDAQGEVYGLTQREICAVLPEITLQRKEETETITRYSVIFGKNRINLYSDSGILDTTCGRMRMVYQVCLPGGWKLPVSLVVETYEASNLQEVSRDVEDTQVLLQEEALRYLNQQMVAGSVLQSEGVLDLSDGAYLLTGTYQCRELIGRRSSTVFLEGD